MQRIKSQYYCFTASIYNNYIKVINNKYKKYRIALSMFHVKHIKQTNRI